MGAGLLEVRGHVRSRGNTTNEVQALVGEEADRCVRKQDAGKKRDALSLGAWLLFGGDLGGEWVNE